MSHPVQSKLRSFVRQVRLLWLLHGLGWFVACGVGLIILLVAADYTLRFEDVGLRVMATAALCTLLIGTLYRFVLTPLQARLGLLDASLRLERRFPQLAGKLASSVEFLSEPAGDPRAGSEELRRIAIHEASQAVEQCDLREALDHRPVIRALSAAMSVVLLAAILFALQPRLVTVGALRLFRPLANDRWPQNNYLALRNRVDRIASGQSFELEVVDRRGKRLPAEVWMIYRFAQPDGSFVEQREQLPIVSEAAIARRDQVTRSFAFRAIGGDDQSMPWNVVEVVDPPAIADLAVTLHYPTYTNWPPAESEKQLRAVAGTTVDLQGRLTKPVVRAKVVHEDGREIPLQLTADGLEFSLAHDAARPLIVDASGAYWFEFVDTDGLMAGPETRYDMRALPDLAPSVTIDTPAASSFATPSALIPVRVTASDDLAIRQIELLYLRTDQSEVGSQSIVIYDGPATAQVPADTADISRQQGERRSVEHRWNLADLGLSPGTQLTFQAAATDYQPSTGESTPRQLTIVAPEDLERRLEERHGFLLAELNRVVKLQRSSRQHLGAVQIQAQSVGELQQPDLERLQAAELDQRQVDRALSSRGDGLRSQLMGVLTDIENNRLDNPEIKRRTEAIERELARIERDQLPRIERALTNSQKRMRANRQGQVAPADATSLAELQDAARTQDQVIGLLEQLLGGLTQWDSQRRLVRELAELQQEQHEISRRTAELGRETLAKGYNQLSPQQQANLKKLAAAQQELSRRFDLTQQNMRQAGRQLELDDPLASQAIADAMAKSSEAATAGKMRQAGANIDENQIGQAAARQQSVAADLQEMLDILSNRREHELSRLVKKLRETELELAQLREEHAQVRKQLHQQARSGAEDRAEQADLARRERDLEQQTERMARKLERLQAERPAGQLAQAAGKMGQAGTQSEQGQADEASDSANAAQQDLERAQAQLAQRRQQAERDLAHEQFLRMRDQVADLRDRQERAIEETRRLESLRTAAQSLTSGQRSSLTNSAGVQEELAGQSDALARKLAPAQAFALAMSNVSESMRKAVDLLRGEQTGGETVRHQQRALQQLENLLAALNPDQPDSEAGPPDDQGGGDAAGGGDTPPGEQIADVAQLKLIKLMQQELNLRTADVSQQLAAGDRTNGAAQRELQQLVREQRRLAEVVRTLAQPQSTPRDDGRLQTDDDVLDLMPGS